MKRTAGALAIAHNISAYAKFSEGKFGKPKCNEVFA
jgi:hypothetical protein